ncbi:MAG: M13 family metallopeptidase [Holophagaceae bacterium]|uniref:M13 family metallopeptidase n=1 Tax=Candidatus Geothrix skivensis TaxID=2954439 RepID=A0A9D7SL48_9BACT|nr:M13 family metallopeptidase [Candidatus Geothrix skivensis]
MRPSLSPLALFLAVPALVAGVPKGTPTAPAQGLDLAGMDRSVAPGDDFFAFANGTWVKRTEIPADRGSFGVGHEVADLTDRRTAALIQAAAASKAPAGSDLRKIGDCYTSYMGVQAIEAKGLSPLKPILARIEAIGDRQALARYLGTTLRADVDVLNATNYYTDNLFGLWVAQDLDEPTKYAPFLLQGGLGLPERSYYLDPSEGMGLIRAQYFAHVTAMLKLLGLAEAEKRAAAVVDLETRMAKVHASREDSGDVLKGNNHWTRADFATKAPGLDWEAFFGTAELQQPQVFVVWQPGAFTGLSALTAEVSLEVWKDYLAFHALQHRSRVLPKAVVDQTFSFYGRVLNGATQPRERWKHGVDQTNAALGEVVGKAYVARYFPPAEKARAQSMVANIVAAFRARIEHLDWMSPATKAKAVAKLATLKVGVGYPDRWQDYSGLKIVAGDAFGNAERAERFEYVRNLRKLGQPIDRTEWVMTPQTVNAVNLPVMNALNFPAAILQPPYFDPKRPVVMDYGSIGAVIGHEISHSFDDSGSLFDASGKLNNWWTPEDLKHFEASADQLVKQYNAYEPFPGLHINGKLTLGENIADVAGLAAAYDAYRLSLRGKAAPVVQGFSGDQQFFISYAQSWREKTREPRLRQQILTDGHAPAQWRPATVRNLDAWYPAFGVKPGQTLYLAPGDRVKVW